MWNNLIKNEALEFVKLQNFIKSDELNYNSARGKIYNIRKY